MQWLRRYWPWLVGGLIVVFIARKVPFAAFRDAMNHGPHVRLAAVDLAVAMVQLCTESIATWIGLIALRMRRAIGAIAAVRGATLLLYIVNYALGQGGFGYYLHRTGVPPLRALGATLFLMGTNLAAMLVVTAIAWTAGDAGAPNQAMWWTLMIGCGGLAAYLLVIVVGPAFLARREVLAPLFESGLRGHVAAIVARFPHMAVVVLGHWVAMRTWGIPVPFAVAMTVMPAVAIASVLPISPAGLGTTQMALVYFFSDYAAGATADDRAAHVLAFSIVHFVYSVAAALLVGVACTIQARRMGALPSTKG